ncbi:MAG TPA: ADP-forming succinate--CoA ligase subunit beta [Fibrobacteria bacterium]|jgi:succinyl-CoA synthetase beta subunit|nr:ADP-forming succinate--CoA ligase subunit beta [Fibrobacteria bacterium]
MKLHEYQGKALLRKAGLPVPRGEVVFNASEVPAALKALGGEKGVAKAQAFTGGRGKAGGIKLFASSEEAQSVSKQLIGMTLVTHQTGPEGVRIEAVLLEEQSQVKRELYFAVTLDRAKANIVFILSPEGGMDIEEIADKSPEKILKLWPDWKTGPDDGLLKAAADFLGLEGTQAAQFADIARKLYKSYVDADCSLLEINPLAVNAAGDLILLDAKVLIDDNAEYRQKETGGDPDAEKDPGEIEAAKYGLSYIKLDGDIGCMVNGAGLAMATMDIIAHYGKQPANFLDVGGSASEEAVTKAFEIITSDKNVKAILVNIFGGIMPCDRIARGIIAAVNNTGLKVPLVVRLEGTNVEEGKATIAASGLNLISADDLEDGARKVAELVKG